MSETPRTDAVEWRSGKNLVDCQFVVFSEFARQLETELADKGRQLAEARADAEHWKGECNALQRMVHESRAEIDRKDKLVEQMREALKLALAADQCPAKNYWQTVETEHHRRECWHAKAEAALAAERGE